MAQAMVDVTSPTTMQRSEGLLSKGPDKEIIRGKSGRLLNKEQTELHVDI